MHELVEKQSLICMPRMPPVSSSTRLIWRNLELLQAGSHSSPNIAHYITGGGGHTSATDRSTSSAGSAEYSQVVSNSH